MCYKKPGPRCSSSAAKALIEAKSLVRAKGGGDFEAREALEEAQLEYDATPAGMKELERRIKQASNSHNSSQKTEYELRLNLGKAKRQERLDLIKEIDRGDVRNHNDSQEAVFPEIFHRFSQEGEEHHLPLSNKQLRDLISDCNHYTNKLDADELEALSWFTSNGSSIMNRFIATRDADFQLRDYRDDESFDEFDAREAEEKERYLQSLARTEHELESALQKAKRETPLRVFRGINADHLEREGYDDEAERYIRDKYNVVSPWASVSILIASVIPGFCPIQIM